MLIVRCAACKKKLFRYDKIGKGHVVRCHKARIERDFGGASEHEGKLICACGKEIGIDKVTHYRMIAGSATFSGTKRTS